MAAPERTFEAVAQENAEWEAKARQEPFDAGVEAKALTSLLGGSSKTALSEACAALSQGAQLADAERVWAAILCGAPPEHLGEQVREVVERLDAPHLRPSGIEQRLLGGTLPACHGLLSLVKHMSGGAGGGGGS